VNPPGQESVDEYLNSHYPSWKKNDLRRAAWQEGFDAAKEQYIPVLLEHLRILADIRAGVEMLPDEHHYGKDRGGCIDRAAVLALFVAGP
jgi:hypothetical protein